MRAHRAYHLLPHFRRVLAIRLVDQELRTRVRGHDDQRVAEVHGAALAVGQAAVVEHLQQHIEDIGMRLLDLLEQHHRIRPPLRCFGERAPSS